jgi:GxxExxY protein
LKILIEEEKLAYEVEKEFEVNFHNKKAGKFRCDLIIAQKVILEIKAVEGNMPKLFEYQLLAYMKATGIKTGLLINFGNKSCVVRRLVSKSP